MPSEQKPQKVCFRIDDEGWIYLSEILGKIILRAHWAKVKKRSSDKKTQHRAFEYEFNTTVKVKSKLFDITDFPKE